MFSLSLITKIRCNGTLGVGALMGMLGVAGQSGSICRELQGNFIQGALRNELQKEQRKGMARV